MLKAFHLPGFLLLAAPAWAQAGLVFDKRLIECEDRWVVFTPDKDGSYSYGFVYIDAQAGPTHKYGGRFRIGPDGRWQRVAQGLDSTNILVRLQPGSQARVAWLPAARLAELRLPAVPDWLHFYQTDTSSVAHYYRWGYTYNAYDAPGRALPYLLRAGRLAPADPRIDPELAYTYNALQRYAEALPVASRAVAGAPKNCYAYKELAYAQGYLGQLAQAADTYAQARSQCTDPDTRCEIAYNIAYQYFRRRDKVQFLQWAAEVRRQAKAGDRFRAALADLEAKLDR